MEAGTPTTATRDRLSKPRRGREEGGLPARCRTRNLLYNFCVGPDDRYHRAVRSSLELHLARPPSDWRSRALRGLSLSVRCAAFRQADRDSKNEQWAADFSVHGPLRATSTCRFTCFRATALARRSYQSTTACQSACLPWRVGQRLIEGCHSHLRKTQNPR